MVDPISPTRRSPRAFTLVELLVVIAIIAVLAGLLLPAVSRAAESGRSAVCTTNIRQMGLGALVYASDQGGRLPSFRNWLCVKSGDLTTGRLFPYAQARDTYLCPTDARQMTSRKRISVPSTGGPRGRTGKRDYSYAMNCCLCHEEDTSTFIAPSQTMLFMEALMAKDDYSGQAGPTFGSRTLATRHNKKGHYVMTDGHVERMNDRQSVAAEKMKRFWFPTENTKGPGGNNLANGLQ